LTYGTKGKQAASSTFSGELWHLRNIGRDRSPSTHSKPEIAPPTEGLSSSRNRPAASASIASLLISDIFLSTGFTDRQLRWG
jgi:hypothetical protein